MTAQVAWILDMQVADGQLDALKRLMSEMSAATEKYATRFFDLLTPTRFLLYGSPDASVQNALAAFGPTYMTPAAGFFR